MKSLLEISCENMQEQKRILLEHFDEFRKTKASETTLRSLDFVLFRRAKRRRCDIIRCVFTKRSRFGLLKSGFFGATK